MAATLPPPRLLPSGDSAITVEFSRNIDDVANRRVLALDRAMAAEPLAGVTETVPTYRSLLVHYDPTQVDFDALEWQAEQGQKEFHAVRMAGDGDTVQAYGLRWNGFGDGCAHGIFRFDGMLAGFRNGEREWEWKWERNGFSGTDSV
jgi:hypothetical protein